MKKAFALLLTLAMTLSLAACGGNSGDTEDTSGSDAAGEVYYLNFKPEADDQWQELAKLYTGGDWRPCHCGHCGLQHL